MIAKVMAALSKVGRVRKELTVLAAVVGAVAASHELTGTSQHYAVQAAAVLGALALFVKNLPNPAPEAKAAPPSPPAPSTEPAAPVAPAPAVVPDRDPLPPLIPPA